MRSGIQPGEAAAHQLDFEGSAFEIETIQIGDFEFAACRGF